MKPEFDNFVIVDKQGNFHTGDDEWDNRFREAEHYPTYDIARETAKTLRMVDVHILGITVPVI